MFLISSKFGYIVTGKFPDNNQCLCHHVNTLVVTTKINQIIDNLEDLWSLQTVGTNDPVVAKTDEEALRKFNETITFEEGRYQVTWPQRYEDICLSDNFNLAFTRLNLLINRLKFDKTLFERYNQILQQQLYQCNLEEVDTPVVTDTRKYYLPHHQVINPSKTTTKVHIVYDASVKFKIKESSLNECFYKRPVILPDFCGLLLRFRLHSILLLVDIEKAFLQLGIQLSDGDVTRFLWLKDIAKLEVDDNVVVYHFCRVSLD